MSESGLARQYREKPVTVEAAHVSALVRAAEHKWLALPEWVRDAYEDAQLVLTPEGILIRTLEGDMRAQLGDWLIRGVRGELYPCKPDIFAATYELADSTQGEAPE